MKRYLLIYLLLLCSIVQAQKKILTASCEMGQGCTFTLSNISVEEMEFTMGVEPGTYTNLPPNAMLVFYKDGRGWKNYIETKRTRGQLDKFFGGDGYTQIYLFDPRIQPLDGEWQAKVGTITASECMVDIKKYMSFAQGHISGGTLTFTKPFSPRFLMDSPEVKWIQLEPNKFKGIFNFGQANSPMQMTYLATVVNEKEIQGVVDFVIKIPSKETCTAKIPIVFTFKKPFPEEDHKDRPGTKVDPLIDDPFTKVDPLTDTDDELLDINTNPSNPDKPNNKIDRIDDSPTKIDPLNDADDDLLDINNPTNKPDKKTTTQINRIDN
jgi:hypothetical protein